VQLAWGADEIAFRDELVAFLDEHTPSEIGSGRDYADEGSGAHGDDHDIIPEWSRRWQATLFDHGWMVPGYAPELGGRNATPVQTLVYLEEMARRRLPRSLHFPGYAIVAPSLLEYGSDEQKQLVPAAIRGDTVWCIGMSEPNAGSDLAGLQTRAVIDGDHFVINGQKVWTSYAQFADWGLCLARTNPDVPKQQGISAFAIDMRSPGVEVRPLHQITDESEFNEVFFADVFVPEDRLIGPEDEGWRVANSTLTHERGVNPRQLVIHIQLLEELLRLAEEEGAFDDPRLAPRLAQAAAEVRLFQLHNWRTLSRVAKGQSPGPEGSALKLYWSEMSKRLHDTVMAVLGPSAPLWFGADDNPGGGTWQRSWLYYQASSIWAGTNEIQRNILSERVLGMPRDPK
jgi:alkylation response protein AidB-like acyl-CoA dehydrogenase